MITPIGSRASHSRYGTYLQRVHYEIVSTTYNIYYSAHKHDRLRLTIWSSNSNYIFQADCWGCGCAWGNCGKPPGICGAGAIEGNAGIVGIPAIAAEEFGAAPREGDADGGPGSLRFFSKCANHLCTDSSLRRTVAKDWSLRASGRHWRSASFALGCSDKRK